MKKIKYFMPALAVASVASGVTPMITSCKDSSSEETSPSFEFQFIKDKKFTAYTSQVTMAEKKTYESYYDLDDAYVEAVKNNPQILADDYLINLSALIKEYKSDIIQLFKDVTIKVSNISVKSVISLEFTQNQPYKHFFSYDVEMKTTSSRSTTEWQTTQLIMHYKDLPFHFLLNTGKGYVSQLAGQGGITTLSFLTEYWPQLINNQVELACLLKNISPSVGADIRDFDKDGNTLDDYSVEAVACDVTESAARELYVIEQKQCEAAISIMAKCFSTIEMQGLFISQLAIFSTYLTKAIV